MASQAIPLNTSALMTPRADKETKPLEAAFLHSSQSFRARAAVLRRGCAASGDATWEMTECTKPTTRDVNELTAIPARNYLMSAVSDDHTDLIFHTLSYTNMALIPMHSTLPYKSPQQLYLKMYTPLQPTASSNFFFSKKKNKS